MKQTRHYLQKEFREILDLSSHIFACLGDALSILTPSSSCSATLKSGILAGMIRRGEVPGIAEYLPKSFTPLWSRKKSSSKKHCPVTSAGGELRMPMIASEKMVGFRRLLLSERFTSVAADSMA